MESFPEDVRKFLQSSVRTWEQLEILRVLGDAPDREWTAEEICTQAHLPAESIQAQLLGLQERGLLRCRKSGGQSFCQFSPHSAELEAKARRLLELYRQRPVSTIRLVYEQPAASLRDFADAFRLRKKEP